MRTIQFLMLLSTLILTACVHINESSAAAGRDQIKTHLMAQLHCQVLDLKQESDDKFSGCGKNDTGEFTITVKRLDEKISFHGVYTGGTRGSFSGTASWKRTVNTFAGFTKHRHAEQNSIGTP